MSACSDGIGRDRGRGRGRGRGSPARAETGAPGRAAEETPRRGRRGVRERERRTGPARGSRGSGAGSGGDAGSGGTGGGREHVPETRSGRRRASSTGRLPAPPSPMVQSAPAEHRRPSPAHPVEPPLTCDVLPFLAERSRRRRRTGAGRGDPPGNSHHRNSDQRGTHDEEPSPYFADGGRRTARGQCRHRPAHGPRPRTGGPRRRRPALRSEPRRGLAPGHRPHPARPAARAARTGRERGSRTSPDSRGSAHRCLRRAGRRRCPPRGPQLDLRPRRPAWTGPGPSHVRP